MPTHTHGASGITVSWLYGDGVVQQRRLLLEEGSNLLSVSNGNDNSTENLLVVSVAGAVVPTVEILESIQTDVGDSLTDAGYAGVSVSEATFVSPFLSLARHVQPVVPPGSENLTATTTTAVHVSDMTQASEIVSTTATSTPRPEKNEVLDGETDDGVVGENVETKSQSKHVNEWVIIGASLGGVVVFGGAYWYLQRG
eukprot:3933933-Rhodomonas_salina.1